MQKKNTELQNEHPKCRIKRSEKYERTKMEENIEKVSGERVECEGGRDYEKLRFHSLMKLAFCCLYLISDLR